MSAPRAAGTGSPKPRVKICGLTRLEDAVRATELGAWALGFILHSRSPRAVTAVQVRAIIEGLRQRLGPRIPRTYGVFVNEPVANMQAIARAAGIDAYQLHGDESPEIARALDRPWTKAFRLRAASELSGLAAFAGLPGCEGLLLDTPGAAGEYGGTGRISDWSLARQAMLLLAPSSGPSRDAADSGQFARDRAAPPIILSGGINPANVRAAIAQVAPPAIDLSSGVEAAPGIKDHRQLEELFDVIDHPPA